MIVYLMNKTRKVTLKVKIIVKRTYKIKNENERALPTV